ncbi:MAG: glycosyltransferase family 2 protein [Alphaproteobacteria bacterium]|nr:glycosyltransferase family 2 protein [Alphaproteobacteria bacterium]
MSVAILIVAFNSKAHLQRQIAALETQTYRDFCAVLIDNASRPEERTDPTALPSWMTLIQSEENLGFAGGNNRAAAAARDAELLALLNPDAFPEPGWLQALVDAAARRPQAAAFGSTQLLDADPSRLDGAGDALHAIGIPWRGGFGMSSTDLPAEGETFAACAAAMLIRAADFHAVGGFDERFFCYVEDVDLGFRLRLMDRATIQVPRAVVRHIGGGVSARGSAFADFHGARNRVWTHVKSMPARIFWPLLPFTVAVTLANLLVNTLKGRAAGWRGVIAALGDLGPAWRARQLLRKGRKASVGDLAAALAWNPLRLVDRRPVIRAWRDPPTRP